VAAPLPAPCAFGPACLHDGHVTTGQPHRAGGGEVGHDDCYWEAFRLIQPTLTRVADELIPALQRQAAEVRAWAAQPQVRGVLILSTPEEAPP
jgi:hypothetical protein